MEILFVHGAGGWRDDRPMAAELRGIPGAEVLAPRFPDEDMSAAGWRRELNGHLRMLGPAPVVVAHSFGASMVLLHYSDDPVEPLPRGLILLAMPFWGSEGWQAEYSLPVDARLPADLPLFLHQCLDDDVVPLTTLTATRPGFRRPSSAGMPAADTNFRGGWMKSSTMSRYWDAEMSGNQRVSR
ncbi:alpha/beta hydrolase [Arthrobacter sp. ATA002]|uniref:alpha/beta fold hydrolase n=1 Tax=Arthrobacter sp. ATA002 TaxID=2991715 RepID=UPI0022A7EC09|nr:alpha/beta hydrolase [Arthrobacter sp. ATA002]WAP50951.1 alpha/beta hydrolase [Arthrobacter sp. ATA002]